MNISPNTIEIILEKPTAIWLFNAICDPLHFQAKVTCSIISLGFNLKATIIFLLLLWVQYHIRTENHGSKVSFPNRPTFPTGCISGLAKLGSRLTCACNWSHLHWPPSHKLIIRPYDSDINQVSHGASTGCRLLTRRILNIDTAKRNEELTYSHEYKISIIINIITVYLYNSYEPLWSG